MTDKKINIKGKDIPPHEPFYWNTSDNFFRGCLGGGGISRTVKTDDSLAVIIEIDEETDTIQP